MQIVYERKCVDYMASVGCLDLCVWPGDVESLRRACTAAGQYAEAVASRIQEKRIRLQQSVDRFLLRLQQPRQMRV